MGFELVNCLHMHIDVEREIFELHALFQNWYRGEMKREDLNARIGIHFADNFYIVFPSAKKQSKDELLTMLSDDYGNEPSFRIEIRNFNAQEIAPSTFLAQYEEWQFWGDGENAQLKIKASSVLKKEADSFLWLMIHETEIE